MDLDKLTIYATNGVPTTSSNTFENCSIKAIYVDADLVNKYKSASNWSQYKEVIYPIGTDVVAGTFTLESTLIETWTTGENRETVAIGKIHVTGKLQDKAVTFDGVSPVGVTLTHQNTDTEYNVMNFEFIFI